MANNDTAKTVLITGATSGIGRATALLFAEEGWNILAHYNSSADGARDLKKAIVSIGAECDILKADLSSKKELSVFIKKCSGFKIDSLINNAGTYIVSRYFGKLLLDEIVSAFTVNVFAPMILSSRLFASMKKNGFGRIVNISSIAAKYGGSAYSMHYGCSKMALEGVTKTLAKEGARHNVLVNTIRPGVIDTEFHKKFPKDMKKRIAMIPAQRMGRPEDVAHMAYYLGSEKNGYVTNETIAVSGGE